MWVWRKMRCLGLPFLFPFLFSISFLPLVQFLENGFQLQPLTVKNHLEVLALTGPCHDTKLLPMRAFNTLFRLVVRLIPNKDDPECHPGLHVNLRFKRRNLAMHRKRTPYMLRRRQRRDI